MHAAVCYVTIEPMTFAKRFRDARLKAGLTQQQIADACGITDGAVSAWEKGVAEGIQAETLFCAADLMGVDPRWLATGEECEAAVNEVFAALRKLPPDQLGAVRQLVLTLKK